MFNQIIAPQFDFYSPPSSVFKMKYCITFQTSIIAVMRH